LSFNITKRHSILVAEDDAEDRYLLQTAFEEQGYTHKIDFVEDGVDVLSYLSAVENDEALSFPQFILLDLNMPRKDGKQVLREVKSNAIFKKIPIIVFTTARNEADVNTCYELGANTYIVKPLSFKELLSVADNLRNYWLETAIVPSL